MGTVFVHLLLELLEDSPLETENCIECVINVKLL